MSIINSSFSIGEQSDGSLIYPNGNILLPEQREIIISNSLNTPVRGSESDIKDIIKNVSNSILIGETGSGKTTELAQMIHEVYPEDLIITNIPLVAATIGTGSYVSDIMYAKTGNPYYALGQGGVGYRTGKGVSEEKRTQITFNTFGLDYLNLSLGNFEKFLNSSSKNIHIVLDEIHEKGEDFVFYLTKVIDLSKKYPGRIKIYGASATVSDNYLDKLTEKFKTISKEIPVTRVEGRTFPINTIEDNGGDIVAKVCDFYKDGKSILVFQPGKAEINKTISALKEKLGDKIEIFPFHSEVSSEELKRNLESSDNQKIFVATNAARTGITLDINAVTDSGLQKTQYYNEFGIPVLVTESITQDAYHQNKGRAGRKEEGDAIYFGYVPVSELEEEAPSSVEIKLDEKKILMELLDKRNILVNENKGVHNYLFNPNKKMLSFSYDWMKKSGLITQNEKITKYGFEVLKLPLSVFNGRIILEAIENNIADEIVTIVSIIENKGFIKRNFNVQKFAQNLFDTSVSDLDLYKKLFDILSSKELDDSILNVFENMGIERSLINYFKSLKGQEKFYKIIGNKLEDIGLKFKNIERVDETIEKIYKYLSNNKDYLNRQELKLSQKELNSLISKCLLSGNLHKIFKSVGNNSFRDFYLEYGDLTFEKSDTSYVDVNDGSIYIGEPFIIGGAGDKDDLAILSFLTMIDESDIELYSKRIYEAYNPKKTQIKLKEFSVDDKGDTFESHSSIYDKNDKQKYLSQNWLPFYLIEKNPYFIEFIKKFNGEFDKDTFIQLLQSYTIKNFSKINPEDKEETINEFKDDKNILEGFIKSQDPNIRKFLNGEKIEKKVEHSKIQNKKNDFLQLVESQNEYNKTLEQIQKYLSNYGLNIESIQEEVLEKFINQLEENSEAYSRIIIFLKRISKIKGNNSIKLEIKDEFKNYENDLEKILKISKRNSWLKSFIENLELLIEGKDISLKELQFGIINDNDLLFESPLIKRNRLLEDINYLTQIFQSIKKFTKKIKITGKRHSKLFISLQKLLFANNTAFSLGFKSVGKSINQLKILIKENSDKINSLKLQKNTSTDTELINKQIKDLNITNSNIFSLIRKVEDFKSIIFKIRGKIDLIDFSSVNYNSEYTNGIYTKKFLYNIIIKKVFNGDFIALYDNKDTKLMEKLRLYSNFDLNEIDELIILIKNVISSKNRIKTGKEILNRRKNTENNNTNKNLVLKIEYLKKIFNEYNLEKKLSISRLEGNDFKNVYFLTENIRKILLEFYPKEIVSLNEKKIFSFSNKIYNFNINSFDFNLKEFILNFSSTIFIKGDIFKDINTYNNLIENLSSYTFVEKVKDSDTKNNDIVSLRENKKRLELINSNIKKVNSYILNFIKLNIDLIEKKSEYQAFDFKEELSSINYILSTYIDDKINPKDIDSNFNTTIFDGYLNIFYELKMIKSLDFLNKDIDYIIQSFDKILEDIKLLIPNKEYIDFELSNLDLLINKYNDDTISLKEKTIELKNIINKYSK